MEDFGTKSGGRINENEQKTIRTPDAPSAPPIVPRKQPKAVMIEIPIDGKCETEREEKEDPFKVSGRVVNTPPSTRGHEQQQQQQQQRHNEEEEEEEEEEEGRRRRRLITKEVAWRTCGAGNKSGHRVNRCAHTYAYT